MEIALTTAAERQLRKLTASARMQVLAAVHAYANDGIGNVKALHGRDGLRLRSGDYRVIFTRDGGTMTIRAVGHRRDIYD